MSLNYNYTKCDLDSYKEDMGEDAVFSIVDVMIWQTILIGLGEYTEKNHGEALKRIRFAEALLGNWCNKFEDDKCVGTQPMPEEWITMVHGMTTNVSDETWSKWKNRTVKNWERDFNWERERKKERGEG